MGWQPGPAPWNVRRGIVAALLGCAALLAVLATPAVAAAGQRTQVALTAGMVERYLASRAAFEKLLKTLEARHGPVPAEEGEDELLALAGYLARPGPRSEIAAVLKRHGFASLDDWANVSYTVLLAAGTLLSPASTGSIAEEKAKVVAEVGQDASLSEEQKRRALAELDEQFGALAAFAPRPANLDAVRPHLDRIRPIISGDP